MNKIKSCDKFGEPITVKYEGEGDYKTQGGACISIFLSLVVLAFAFVSAEQLILRRDPSVSTTTEYSRYVAETQKFNLES